MIHRFGYEFMINFGYAMNHSQKSNSKWLFTRFIAIFPSECPLNTRGIKIPSFPSCDAVIYTPLLSSREVRTQHSLYFPSTLFVSIFKVCESSGDFLCAACSRFCFLFLSFYVCLLSLSLSLPPSPSFPPSLSLSHSHSVSFLFILIFKNLIPLSIASPTSPPPSSPPPLPLSLIKHNLHLPPLTPLSFLSPQLSYRIISGNKAGLVEVDKDSGAISLSPSLNTNVPIHATMEVSVSGKEEQKYTLGKKEEN